MPLEGSPQGDSKIENFFHYIILNPNGSTKSHDGIGDYQLDIGGGVFHIEIGSNRGLVKTVNFSKADLQYIREARFMRNGIDGLLQLSSVYDVSIDMFGNTLFYPGMDLWLNPYGFGGTALGKPTTGLKNGKRSLANMLGLGGYHTITGVTVNLTPNSFTTSIRAQHYYSGDGELGSTSPKTVGTQTDEQLIEEGVLEDSQSIRDAAACMKEIVDLQNFQGNAVEFDIDSYIEERETASGSTDQQSTSTPTAAESAGAEPAAAEGSTTIQEGSGTYNIGDQTYSGEFKLGEDGLMYFHYTIEQTIQGTVRGSTTSGVVKTEFKQRVE